MHSIICLTSLSHSGSTVFSMALACHEDLISLGEVYQVLRKGPAYWLNQKTHLCSCGKTASECNFWGAGLRKMRDLNLTAPDTHHYYQDAYATLLTEFNAQYSSRFKPIDTSKGTKHLAILADVQAIQPQAVFLIRDVRSYASSQARLARSQSRTWFKRVKGHYWYQMLRWLRDNKKRESILTHLALPYTTVGYEPFCFTPKQTLNTVYDFLNVPHKSNDGDLTGSSHHVLFGNPMRNCETRKSEIRYDDRWFSETGYMLPAALIPTLMGYNQKYVYATR